MAGPLLPLLAGLLEGGAVEGAVAATGAVESGGLRALLGRVATLGADGKQPITSLSQGITKIFTDIAASLPSMKRSEKQQPPEVQQQRQQQRSGGIPLSPVDAARKAAGAIASAINSAVPPRGQAVPMAPVTVVSGGQGGVNSPAGGAPGGGGGGQGGGNQPPQNPSPPNPGGGGQGGPGPFGGFIMGALARLAVGGGATGAASRIALGGIGAMTTGLGGPIAGALVKDFIDLGKAIVTLPIKIQQWGDELVESQRHLKDLSGTMAGAFSTLDAERFGRNIDIAGRTADSTKDLTQSQSRLEDALVPWESLTTNIENRVMAVVEDLATSALKEVTSGVETVAAMFGVDLFGDNAKPDLAPITEFARDIADGKYAEPALPPLGERRGR